MSDMAIPAPATAPLAVPDNDLAAKAARLKRAPDDKAMIRAAAELARDLSAANPWIYWADFLASAALGYLALAVAILAGAVWIKAIAAIVSVLALYRAGSFIHEVTHIKHSTVPGFRLGFNLVIGVPMLVPSFMYEGVHNLHHARTRYGTDQCQR